MTARRVVRRRASQGRIALKIPCSPLPASGTDANVSRMAIGQLTDEQIATWSRRQKDQWWLTRVYRGDMGAMLFW